MEPIDLDQPASGTAPVPSPDVDELWRAHHEALRRCCAAMVGPADADDLAADTFLRASDALLSGRVDRPRSYLFRAAVRGAQNERRSRDRERARSMRAATPPRSHDTDELGHVRDAIRALSPRQRAVLFLAYWEDLTERQIAEELDLHVGTVRRHLHRAHHHLREALR